MRLLRRLSSWLSPSLGTRSRTARARFSVEALEDRIAPAVNAIVTENLLPGNPASEWQISGIGDPTLQGFATDISVDQGQTVSFKIDNPQLAAYRVDIYRMGYYAGLGARKVATIPSSQTLRFAQPSPLFDPATRLVDAGNWSVSASWAVPSSATSGVYIARLVREDTGGASHVIFIVRDDDGGSDMLFQTADTTWQAYNRWGGFGLYTTDRAFKVSYNRPFDTRLTTVNGRDFFFGSEYSMVRWVEANGYNVSYFTGVDSDRLGSEIREHKIFLSVGHDEYWSNQQRAHVEAARDSGVHLAFLSGNEVYWKTRWESSISAGSTPYRTMVTYKETLANAKIDPLPNVWTGTWRDPRFSPPADGGRPENALTGQIFTVNRGPGGETGTSFTVPAEFANLRFWRNTTVAALQAGQTATLGDQVLGYEWDEDLDNGFRPAGLFRMSSTTQNVPQLLLDFGSTVGPGTATHSLTLYRASSGALVFGAGTVQWTWGLDGTHDGPTTTPDPAMRQATVNLFADMGAQPATLQPGLILATVSTDVTRPTSSITSPTGGAFTAGTVVTITGTASDAGGVLGAVEVSVDGGATWRRAQGRTSWTFTWTPSTSGPVTIRSRAVDDSGNIEIPTAGTTVTVQYAPTSTTGLVAAYGFNQGSGSTLTDSSGLGNNGTISGASWVAGLYGQALSFDGNNDWVTVSDSNSLDLTSGMTLEAWVRPTVLNDWTTIVMKERPGGLVYSLYASDGAASPSAAYFFDGGSDERVIGLSVLPLNVWTHLAGTYDGSMLRLYVNGTEVSSFFTSGNISVSSGALRIGGNSIWGEHFQGLIDEVRIYNRPLNLAEIRSDLSTPIGGTLETVSPTVSVTAPANGATLSGTVNVTASASDNATVAGVQFLLNGVPLGLEDTAAAYALAWDTRTVANGTYVLTARARDVAGNSSTSSGITITVNNAPDTTPPTASLKHPSNNQPVSGNVTLWTVASDNLGVAGVQFKINGTNLGAEVTVAPYLLVWNTTGSTNGTHNVTAVARDAAGNLTTSNVAAVTVDNTAPTVTGRTPAPSATLVSTTTNLTVTFSEPVVASTISVVVRDPANNAVPGSLTYNETTRTATFAPSFDLNLGTTYTVTVSGVQDEAGNVLAAPVTWSFTTTNIVTNATIWDASTTPAVASAADTDAIEVGVKFRADVNGYLTGIRFYKGATNTGTHVGRLWSPTGTLLATVTFTDETATGWQQANFTTPVAITANTVYVASYHAPSGGYAANASYFAAGGFNGGRLEALGDGAGGGNGVYRYGAGGVFPTSTFGATNYWVDVVFSNVLADTTPPTVTSRSPAPNATGVALGADVIAMFSESVQAGTISFVLRDPANNVVPASVIYNDATHTVTLNPTNDLAQSTTYTVTLSGAQDAAGNPMSTDIWSFTTTGPDLVPPTVISRSPAVGATAVFPGLNVTATFNESVQFTTISFVLRDPANNAVAARVTYNDVTRTVTLNPDFDLAGSTTYTAFLSGAQDLAGNPMSAVSWSFTTDAAITNVTIWNSSATPATASANDPAAIEVGVKIRSDKDGYITGIRFYKGATNTGTHVGHVWSATGTLLGTVNFTGETSSGWQQANFSNPVRVTPNTTYVASYYAPNGNYAFTGAYFAGTGAGAGPVRALANGTDGSNGVFRYGTGGGFPTDSFNSTNYWVDVVFSNSLSDTTPPTVTAQSPATGATQVPISSSVTVTFSESVQSATISMVLRDPANNIVAGGTGYNDSTRTATFTPSVSLAATTTYTMTVSGARDQIGNLMSPVSWSFTTATALLNATIWSPTATPATASVNDPSALELGVKFRSTLPGFITGVRFYKGATNTGTHVGHLWSATGSLLATVTFTNETATGWQQANFSVAVAVAANTTYVVSYYTPTGNYAYNNAYFASSGFTNGPLEALANGADGGNGVFRYGAGGGFPSQSAGSANYWVDIVFSETLGDSIAPTVTNRSPASGATAVSVSANVTATFSEPVVTDSASFVLRDPANNAVAAAVSYNDPTRTITLDPNANLNSMTVYTATLSGARDAAGNVMAPVSWSFTTQGVWQQTTTADFSSGTHSGTTVSSTSGGEVQLAPSVMEEFNGTALGSPWTSSSWASAGGGPFGVTVSGGILSVLGGQVLSAQSYTNQPLEGRINFGATAYQHFGLATGLSDFAGNYWAIFSTNNSSDQLFARVNASGTTSDVNLGALPAGFHNYLVKPIATGFEFWVDGVLKTTIAASFAPSTAMKIAFSAFRGSPQPALQADWVSIASYQPSGTFTSAVFDAGATVTWGTASWTADLPSGTSIVVETSTSTDGTTWSSWATAVNGGAIPSPTGRFIRYRITLTTTDPTRTPVFRDIFITFS